MTKRRLTPCSQKVKEANLEAFQKRAKKCHPTFYPGFQIARRKENQP